jgi:type II secretory pathway pseudopilin PulG
MSFVTAAIIGGGATLAAGYMGSQAAKSAASKQADAARYAAQLQQEQFNLTNEQQRPYREAGYSALSDITGMKPYLTQQYTPEDFAQGIDPGYQFRLQQGQEATNRMANMGGGMLSGNALKGAQDYTQGLASQEYGNAFNRFHCWYWSNFTWSNNSRWNNCRRQHWRKHCQRWCGSSGWHCWLC